jgi:TRAP-type C4-dicarboxylate transport system permease small subunit
MGGRIVNQKLKMTGSFLLKAHDFVCDGLARVGAWMIMAVTLSIGYEIVMRYFFNRPTQWAADFTDYTLLYTTFFAAAWLAKRGEHVNLTYLLDHLSIRSRQVMEAINSFFCAVVCACIVWYSSRDCWDAITGGITMNRALPIPKYFVIWVIPFCCLVLLVQFMRNGFRFLTIPNGGPQDEQS